VSDVATKAVSPHTTVEAVDDDIRQAIATRDAAFHMLMIKDTQHNRDAFAEANGEVDSLLDLRHGLTG
jgi:hypothetical protein